MIRIVYALAIASTLLASLPSHSTERWPQVQNLQKAYNFDDVAGAGFDLPLTDRDGRQLYSLRCHSGLYEADSGFDYSGLLDCRLVSLYSKEVVSTLLTETLKQTTDWTNRGRFLTAHLRTGCATYPDWGQRRKFRLRGMDIDISLSDVKFGTSPNTNSKVQSYSVEVTVKKDPTSATSLTLRPTSPEPPWFYHTDLPCSQ